MRVSHKTIPALNFFLNGEKNVITIDRPFWEDGQKSMIREISSSIQKYRGKINVVSNAFIDAAGVAKESLGPLAIDIMYDMNQELYIEDIYIAGRQVTYIKLIKELKKLPYIEAITLDKSGGLVSCILSDKKNLEMVDWFTSLLIEKEAQSIVEHRNKALMFSSACVVFYLFKHFANVEIKEINKGKKEKAIGDKELIYNELNKSILHLNSTWFTELVRNKEFAVRGHFRLQPKKKNGEWTKELIWIDTFLKHGYHRRPQKEIEGY